MIALLRRLGWSLAVLAGVSALTFCLAFVVPSDPARTAAGPKADEQTLKNIRRELGLDQPVAVQYVRYLSRLLRADLGRSYLTRQRVLDAIAERLPATAALASVSLGLAVLAGVLLGLLTAPRQGSTFDFGMLVASLVALSLPVFWVGMALLYVFAYRLRWLPLGGYGLLNVVLPAATLALGQGAYYARVLHANLGEVLRADYIRTAHAKGLPPRTIYIKHGLRNALLPLVTLIGLDFAGLMSGVVLTETVFNWPGLGRLAVEGVFNQDIPVIMGTVLFGALLVVLANVAVDVIYVLVDPRLRRRR
ncbi:ABC transporter permease [Candidatus Binatia bacterium]|nr:ABC transporter permease [Candidatus Binatia bacterium]